MRTHVPKFTKVMDPELTIKSILAGVTLEEIADLLFENSSLRGFLQGFVAERRLSQWLLTFPEIERVEKIPDQSEEKGDLRVTYKGEIIRIELKSIATDSVRHDVLNDTWQGKVRTKATDRRDIEIEGLGVIRTSCLVKGEFDVLGISTLAVDGQWTYMFMDAAFLPETANPGLIQTSFTLNPLTTPGVQADPLKVFDSILAKKRAKIA
jgi:hypothetical protein